MIDVDDNEYVDYDMGFGALFAGHMNPAVRRRWPSSWSTGHYTSRRASSTQRSASCWAPATGCRLAADELGTEATHDAIRLARGVTSRERIVKVEGGYHGHHDEVMISTKPPLELAGPAERPNPIPSSLGITKRVVEDSP